jgi:xanthine dehydrogenase iron-sulfur cluster and FAD-binding subunit A
MSKQLAAMAVTNTADVEVEDNEPTMVETLDDAAFILEENPNARILIVPRGTVDAMIHTRSVQL